MVALVDALVACVLAVDALLAASVALVAAASDETVLFTVTHAGVAVLTYILLSVLRKYKAPVASAFPSLSRVGAEDLTPRYRSSNESYDAAALVALVAALVACVVAVEAELVAEVALDDALVALDAALVALVAALVADVAAAVAFTDELGPRWKKPVAVL